MAMQSRLGSLDTSHNVHKETNSEPSANEYELERDRRKKALHDRVELALVESGFGEAAKLRDKFSADWSKGTPAAKTSQPRQRRKRAAATLQTERRRSARNLVKKADVQPATSASEGCGKQVCCRVHAEIIGRLVLKQSRVCDYVYPNQRVLRKHKRCRVKF